VGGIGSTVLIPLFPASHRRYSFPVDSSLIEELILKNQPFLIETAAGRVFEVPHRDFINFSRKRTAISIFYEENGEDHFAIIPLLTVTSAMTKVENK
jgi:hypothetical protein